MDSQENSANWVNKDMDRKINCHGNSVATIKLKKKKGYLPTTKLLPKVSTQLQHGFNCWT